MILRPLPLAPEADAVVPAWEAIEHAQKQVAGQYWMVAQPDHAALAGELARRSHTALLPPLDDDVLRAIALHDSGWEQFDGGAPGGTGRPRRDYPSPALCDGRPLSFLDVPVPDFMRAWSQSICRAQESSAIGGTLVSRHFTRIAEMGAKRARTADDQRLLQNFIDGESQNQRLWEESLPYSTAQIELLVDVLQFFDLLSLYLCCGSQVDVTFPQTFGGRSFRVKRAGEACQLQPALFGGPVCLQVPARRFPQAGGDSPPITLLFQLR